MKVHPLCDIFPPLPPADLQALVEDIRVNGLREAITTFDGQILDGANRLRACELAGVTPRFEELPAGTEPRAYVVSRNLQRRHLSAAQRALIGARLATLGEGRPGKTASFEAVSQPAAAKLVGVTRTAIQHAARVIERGVPQLQAAATAGEVSLSAAARIAKADPTEQVRQVINPRERKSAPKVEPKNPEPKRAAKPLALNSFAHRIESQVRDEIDFALEHEVAGVGAWAPKERDDALQLLRRLRSDFDRLIGALEEVGHA